jgi:hypothetical protein
MSERTSFASHFQKNNIKNMLHIKNQNKSMSWLTLKSSSDLYKMFITSPQAQINWHIMMQKEWEKLLERCWISSKNEEEDDEKKFSTSLRNKKCLTWYNRQHWMPRRK